MIDTHAWQSAVVTLSRTELPSTRFWSREPANQPPLA